MSPDKLIISLGQYTSRMFCNLCSVFTAPFYYVFGYRQVKVVAPTDYNQRSTKPCFINPSDLNRTYSADDSLPGVLYRFNKEKVEQLQVKKFSPFDTKAPPIVEAQIEAKTAHPKPASEAEITDKKKAGGSGKKWITSKTKIRDKTKIKARTKTINDGSSPSTSDRRKARLEKKKQRKIIKAEAKKTLLEFENERKVLIASVQSEWQLFLSKKLVRTSILKAQKRITTTPLEQKALLKSSKDASDAHVIQKAVLYIPRAAVKASEFYDPHQKQKQKQKRHDQTTPAQHTSSTTLSCKPTFHASCTKLIQVPTPFKLTSSNGVMSSADDSVETPQDTAPIQPGTLSSAVKQPSQYSDTPEAVDIPDNVQSALKTGLAIQEYNDMANARGEYLYEVAQFILSKGGSISPVQQRILRCGLVDLLAHTLELESSQENITQGLFSKSGGRLTLATKVDKLEEARQSIRSPGWSLASQIKTHITKATYYAYGKKKFAIDLNSFAELLQKNGMNIDTFSVSGKENEIDGIKNKIAEKLEELLDALEEAEPDIKPESALNILKKLLTIPEEARSQESIESVLLPLTALIATPKSKRNFKNVADIIAPLKKLVIIPEVPENLGNIKKTLESLKSKMNTITKLKKERDDKLTEFERCGTCHVDELYQQAIARQEQLKREVLPHALADLKGQTKTTEHKLRYLNPKRVAENARKNLLPEAMKNVTGHLRTGDRLLSKGEKEALALQALEPRIKRIELGYCEALLKHLGSKAFCELDYIKDMSNENRGLLRDHLMRNCPLNIPLSHKEKLFEVTRNRKIISTGSCTRGQFADDLQFIISPCKEPIMIALAEEEPETFTRVLSATNINDLTADEILANYKGCQALLHNPRSQRVFTEGYLGEYHVAAKKILPDLLEKQVRATGETLKEQLNNISGSDRTTSDYAPKHIHSIPFTKYKIFDFSCPYMQLLMAINYGYYTMTRIETNLTALDTYDLSDEDSKAQKERNDAKQVLAGVGQELLIASQPELQDGKCYQHLVFNERGIPGPCLVNSDNFQPQSPDWYIRNQLAKRQGVQV